MSPRLLLRVFPLITATLLGVWLGVAPARSAARPAQPEPRPPAAAARFDNVDVRSGPSASYPATGAIAYGQSCTAAGRDIVTGWWLVRCPGGVTGWVPSDSVNIIGDAALAPLFMVGSQSLPPTPPPPAPAASWSAIYFANKDLAGAPVLAQDVPEVNFNWGLGSPGPSVPADYFSARYERTLPLQAGSYLLTLRMDDGARLFVDDQLVLDDWRAGAGRELAVTRTLGSRPRLRIDYFEENGEAAISFAVTRLDAPPDAPQNAPLSGPPLPALPPAPELPVMEDQWRVEVYNNTDLGGEPVAALYQPRGVYPLDLRWGEEPPAAGAGADFWSARYEGRFYFAPGSYAFFAVSDDGVRVYIDDILLINAWHDGNNDRTQRFDQVGEGWHTLRVEHYERTGDASVRVWWSFADGRQLVTGPIPPPPTSN